MSGYSFASLVRKARLEKGYTLQDVKARAGIAESLLSKVENGSSVFSPRLLKNFCELCNADYELLAKAYIAEAVEKKRLQLMEKYGIIEV